jgi:hypothetical protein
MLMGLRTRRPRTSHEVRDHNVGVGERDDLEAFLQRQSRASRKFFRKILEDPQVVELLEELADVRKRWHDTRTGPEHRDAFDRMHEMETVAFARSQAARLKHAFDPIRNLQ